MDSNAEEIKKALNDYKENIGFFAIGTFIIFLIALGLTCLAILMFGQNLLVTFFGSVLPDVATPIRAANGSGNYLGGDFRGAAIFLTLFGPFLLYALWNSFVNLFTLASFRLKGGVLVLSESDIERSEDIIRILPVSFEDFHTRYPDPDSWRILTILRLIGAVGFKKGQIIWMYEWDRSGKGDTFGEPG